MYLAALFSRFERHLSQADRVGIEVDGFAWQGDSEFVGLGTPSGREGFQGGVNHRLKIDPLLAAARPCPG